MQLIEFIQAHRQKIVDEWVEFAATLLPWAKGLDDTALKDHAEELLAAIVRDMKLPQSSSEQAEKSKGNAEEGALGRVGHKHASERLEAGFNLEQLVSEYRALRASVLRLWEGSQGDKQDEVTRFNEAIDEALAESTARYSDTVSNTREQFLGILGHDLRSPLSSIILGATQLTKSETLDDREARVGMRILNSAQRMSRMVSDLLDLTRTRLGSGIPVSLKPTDLEAVCQQVVAEMEAVHPGSEFRFEATGDLKGEWDGDRLSQVISNLVANAAQYGSEGGIINLTAHAQGNEVVLQVHNDGPPIPENALKKIFEPMVRREQPPDGDRNVSGLGLGLYIAREIVTAHGGTVEVTSTEEEGTTFRVQIPRQPSPQQEHTLPNAMPLEHQAPTIQ